MAGAALLLLVAAPAAAQGPPANAHPPVNSPSTKVTAKPRHNGDPDKALPGTVNPLKPPVAAMEVSLVRSNEPGCEPDCPEWIAADGTIDRHSPVRLKKALARLGGRKLPIFINSPGGSVDDAITMAGIIRAKGLDVVVARTDLQHCGPKDAVCNALKANSIRLGSPAGLARCASSCPFVLAGGVRRMVGNGAYVGVHRAATYRIVTRVMRTYRLTPRYEWGVPVGTTRKLVSEKSVGQQVKPAETTKETYDRIEANFVAMGISREVMRPMLATPNSDMRWLTPAEVERMRLSTDRLNGHQILALAKRSADAGQAAKEEAGALHPATAPSPSSEAAAATAAGPAAHVRLGLPLSAPGPAAGR